MRENLAREQLLDDLLGDADDVAALYDLAARAAQQRLIAATPTPILYQQFDGATILRGGEPWWGAFHVDGVFVRDADLCRRAQRNSMERDHAEALRRNDWFDRAVLRYELSDTGRAELAS